MKIFATLIAFLLVIVFSRCARASDLKSADLAGTWYPSDKAELSGMIEGYLKAAPEEKSGHPVFAIISPHAGFLYSGSVAAYGYNAVKDKGFKTVVIVGFSHRSHFDGISVYAKGSWRTPLGNVDIDEDLAGRMISKDKRISFEPALFNGENSVEMQVPFVQVALKGARIVPIAFGTQDYEDARLLGRVLAEELKDRDDVLVVASTDLSHFHPYKDAVKIDKALISALSGMSGLDIYKGASSGSFELCGAMPVTSVLIAAAGNNYNDIKVLKYANSADTTGDRTSVVGYLSAVIYKGGRSGGSQAGMLSEPQRKRLLQIARESIACYLKDGKRKAFTESDPVLNSELGAFVTLHEAGQLRGCIGNMVGQGPLYRTVADMAIEAATGDPRFPQLEAEEVGNIDIEISVLSPLKLVGGYKDVKIPGDGVLIKSGYHSGVFLPQVATENGWGRDEFLTYLCAHKAGLKPDAWKDPKTQIYTFSAEVFGEK